MKQEINDIVMELLGVISTLASGPSIKVSDLPPKPRTNAVFAIYEGGELLHVGKSGDTLKLVRRVCMKCDNYLPVKLTRLASGKTHITYDGGPESWDALMADPAFADEYRRQVARLANAEVRIAEVDGEAKRDAFHAMAQYTLGRPYNDPH